MTAVALTARAYAGEQDLVRIAEFLNLCEAHDRLEEGTSVDELRTEFTVPHFDATRDLQLFEDENGRLIGFGQLWAHEESEHNDGFLWFKIHPDHRTGEIDPQLFAWAEERLREIGRVELRVTATQSEPERATLIEQHGFQPVRYFMRMTRSLAEPIPEPLFPDGYTLRDGYHDPQAWAELYNESFVDHYNFHRQSAEQIQHWQKEPDHRPDLNLVAVAPDGSFAAFAWCTIRTSGTERTGLKIAWVDLLGTRRGHRRIGLGRAMLLAGLQRMRAASIGIAWLGVDAASPTGATGLYDETGFTKAYTRTLYGRKLS